MQHPARALRRYVNRRWSRLAGLLLGALACSPVAGATAVGRLAAEFGVDPAGAATYVVPVSVAAGRGGLRPNISLRYASHDGDGLAGVGFTLTGLSRITRCPLTIAVDGRVQGVRFAAGDRFCLDGQPLVLVAGTYGADGAEYRTEVNNLQRVISRGRQGSGPGELRGAAPGRPDLALRQRRGLPARGRGHRQRSPRVGHQPDQRQVREPDRLHLAG